MMYYYLCNATDFSFEVRLIARPTEGALYYWFAPEI